MDKAIKILKNLFIIISIPLVTYIIFYVLCQLKGVSGFGVGTDLTVIIRNTIYSTLIALAVSYNLTSGRLDFSIGSTLILSTIIAGQITLNNGLGPVSLLLIAMVVGVILGLISGGVYILLGLPPMVVSLGVTMIYEAIAFNISGGSGVKLIGRNDLLIWAHQPYIFIILIGVIALLYILLNYTKFGYDTNSLRNGQEIAVTLGINEKRNTLICYGIAGLCLGAAGVINMSVLGTVTPNLSLASISYIQNAFMPMFIGTLLAKFFDRNTGVLMGALTQSIIFSGIGKLGVPSAWQAVVTGVIVLGFFAYSFNSYRIVEYKLFKQKREKALLNQN